MIKFRTRNHRLPIETGNWSRTPIDIRFCNSCHNQIGDEFHYLFQCSSLQTERQLYIKPHYYRRPSTYKMEQLINTKNRTEYLKLCKFVKIILTSSR